MTFKRNRKTSVYLLERIGSLGLPSDRKSGELWLKRVISLGGLAPSQIRKDLGAWKLEAKAVSGVGAEEAWKPKPISRLE